jgi:hypothetical protein
LESGGERMDWSERIQSTEFWTFALENIGIRTRKQQSQALVTRVFSITLDLSPSAVVACLLRSSLLRSTLGGFHDGSKPGDYRRMRRKRTHLNRIWGNHGLDGSIIEDVNI